mgnify:CR=1 FL=1
MPSFCHNLIGIGQFCNADCTLQFSKWAVSIFNPASATIQWGWCQSTGPKLWHFALHPAASPHAPTDVATTSLQAFSTYDLPSIEALVCYFHAMAGFPIKSTWLAAIKARNYQLWLGLTYANASKYCPIPKETLQGHMTQTCQGIHSTKPKPPIPTLPPPI